MKSISMQKAIAPVLVALGLMAVPDAAEAKIKNVRVEGEAAVVEGDRAATEKAVKRAARRKAVEEGAGVMVNSNTIIRNFQMVKDEIATTSRGVITDEQWGDMKVSDGVAKISLTAKVSPEAVEDAVCAVVKANHDPKIALVFVEKYGDDSQPWVATQAERGRIEAMFTEAFMKNCFTIVEPGVRVTEVAANGDLPQETIKKIVENSNAQFVLLGQGKVTKSDKRSVKVLNKTSMNSYSITANVRLLNTETNVIDAVSTQHAQMLALSPDHAMKQTSRNGHKTAQVVVDGVMDDLFKKITEKWASDLVNASTVSVTVKGVKNYRTAKEFRAGVEKILKGSKVTQRTLKKGTVILEVQVEGGADAFASAIDTQKFGRSTAEVLEVAPGKVVLQLN